MAAVTRRCEHCDEEFAAKRSDARTCSARCRQALHRRRPESRPAVGKREATRVAKAVEAHATRVKNTGENLELLPVLDAAQVTDPEDARLWAAQAREARTQVSRFIKQLDELAERAASPDETWVRAGDVRVGDWVFLPYGRRRVTEVVTEPPATGGACFTRPDNTWLRVRGLQGLTAILRDELIRVER